MGDRLREIRARRAAITPGEWRLTRYDHGGGRIYVAGERAGGADGEQRALVLDMDTHAPDGVATAYHEGDREFFLAAPADHDWLIAEVEALRALLGEAAPYVGWTTETDTRTHAMNRALALEAPALLARIRAALGDGGSDG